MYLRASILSRASGRTGRAVSSSREFVRASTPFRRSFEERDCSRLSSQPVSQRSTSAPADRFADHQAPALRADDRSVSLQRARRRPIRSDPLSRCGRTARMRICGRASPRSTTNRLADGTFVIDGLLGRHRLTVRSSGNWFPAAATLENGTDIANGPIDFEPGRTYGNVRVWLSDETAEIEGSMPEGWSADSHSMIMVFPEDMSLWQDNRPSIQLGVVASQTRRFSVKRIPPGQMYLVAALSLVDPQDPRAGSEDFMEILNELWPRATRIFIGEAGKFEVTLPPLPRDR